MRGGARNVRPVMEKKIKEDMRKFFSMSQSEQEAEIDRRIEEMEARRKNGWVCLLAKPA